MTKILVTEPNKEPVIRDMTAEEQAEHDSRINNTAELEVAEKQNTKNNQASGNQKLLDLGLTQAEATALTGYTPPIEEDE